MSVNSRNYTTALYGFDAVVRRVPSDRWDAPSPCDGWSARDVVAHASGVVDAVAEMARTGEVAMPQTPDADTDPVEVWHAAFGKVLDALDQPDTISRVGAYWFGATTIDELVAFTTWDPLGHSWDVATAVGIDAHLSPDVAEASIAVIAANADTLRSMKLMADPVEVSADASAADRFLGLTGRNPAR